MFLSIRGKVINAFIEPQFRGVGSSDIVTVQFSDWESLSDLRKHQNGDLRFSPKDREFPFVGYTHTLSLSYLTDGPMLKEIDLRIDKDFSPAPAAFYWCGWEVESQDEEENQNCIVSAPWEGHCLPGEVDDIWFGMDLSFEEFLTYPVFTLPEELATQQIQSSLEI